MLTKFTKAFLGLLLIPTLMYVLGYSLVTLVTLYGAAKVIAGFIVVSSLVGAWVITFTG
jgi:hypothetical protein